MYGGHIRHGLPILGGAGALLGDPDDDPGDGDDIINNHGGGFNSHDGGGHDGGLGGGGFDGGHGGGFGGAGSTGGGHAGGGHTLGGGLAHGPHGALPFTGFDSLKLAFIALVLVVGGLLLMRMVMLISNDN
jgi:hypothetical protein